MLGEVVKLYALQLLSLVKEAMGIEPAKAFKLETPYGLQLKWSLPNGMPFVLHLKDKVKVCSDTDLCSFISVFTFIFKTSKELKCSLIN